MKKKKEALLVIYVTDDRKVVVALVFVGANLVEWVKPLSVLRDSSVFEDVIDFREPSLEFFGFKLKFFDK